MSILSLSPKGYLYILLSHRSILSRAFLIPHLARVADSFSLILLTNPDERSMLTPELTYYDN